MIIGSGGSIAEASHFKIDDPTDTHGIDFFADPKAWSEKIIQEENLRRVNDPSNKLDKCHGLIYKFTQDNSATL